VLELGDTVGVLVIEATVELNGREIEISPVDGIHDHDHDHAHGDAHAHAHRTHSMVRERGTAAGKGYAAVYPGLAVGTYTVWRDHDTPVVTVSTRNQLDTVQAQNQQIAAVLTAPDAKIATGTSSTGGTATVVLSYAEQKMIFTSSGLPRLPNAKVYELWLLSTGSAIPAGLLPEPTNGKTAPVLAAGLTSADKVGVTVEPAGGTSAPTTTPILVMTLPG
jgi:hypothetical protein